MLVSKVSMKAVYMIVIYHVNDYNEMMEAKQNLHVPVLLGVSFLGQMSIGIMTLALVFFTRERFSLSPGRIGLFASSGTLCYLLGCMTLQGLMKRLRPNVAANLAALSMAAFGICILFAPVPLTAFLSYMGYGLVMSMYWPPIMGWLTTGVEGQALSRRISFFNLSWSFGIGLAPFIAGILVERSPGSAIGFASLVMLLISIILMTSAKAVPEMSRGSGGSPAEGSAGSPDQSTPLRYIGWFGVFSAYFLFGVTMNVFPLFAHEQLLMRESVIGLLLLVRGMVTAVCFILLGRFTWWHFNWKQMISMQIVLSAVCLIAVLASSLPLYIAFFALFGVAFAQMYTNSIFHGAAGSSDRASRMAVHEAYLTAGTIFGSSLGGAVFQRSGYPAVMVMSSILFLLIISIQAALFRGAVRRMRISS